MKLKLFLFMAIFCGLFQSVSAQQIEKYPFENEIRKFKSQDSIEMPAPGGILFIGSSSIRKWEDLEKRFSDKPIIRRGVGGSELRQLRKYYVPLILLPYKPAKVFLYEGENDIAAGLPATEVLEEFKKLFVWLQQELPETKIYYLSIKYSPSRLKWTSEITKANDLIQSYLKNKPNAQFIDVANVLRNDAGQTDSTLFLEDQLHLNGKGYDRWEKVIRPFL